LQAATQKLHDRSDIKPRNSGKDYAEYAPALWQKGIKTPRQLANFSEPHYLACDVPEGHIDDIKARADTTG